MFLDGTQVSFSNYVELTASMSRKASIVWGVVPLSEAQAYFDLKLREQAHKTNTETKGEIKKEWNILIRGL